MIVKKLLFILFVCLGVNILFSQVENVIFTTEEQEWIQNHPTVRFGYEKNWPPFEIYEKGEYIGISGDYIKLIEQYTGIDMQPIPNITWLESVKGLQEGSIHAVALAGITENRSEYLDFTQPHIKDPLVIVTKDSYPFVTGLHDFVGKTICVPHGYYTEDLLIKDFPKIKIKNSNTIKSCLLDVSTGRADAYVGSLSVITYNINMYGYANLKIASPTKYQMSEFAFAVTKDWSTFRDIVDKVFKAIPQHEKRAIAAKWVAPVQNDHLIDLNQLIQYIIYLLFLIFLVFFLFYLWNRSLKKQIKKRNKAEKALRKSISLIKEKHSENGVLLKEVHHRVKNNLQMVYSMLNMQVRKIDNTSSKKVLLDANSRVMAMSLIHKAIYETDNFDKVNVSSYINLLILNVKKLYGYVNENIKIRLDIQDITLNIDDVIPLGLVINELVVNSYKHAFPNEEHGEIFITLQKRKNEHYFEYRDTGNQQKTAESKKDNTLGLFLIDSLIQQLEAENITKNESDFTISFTFKGVNGKT